MALRDSVFCDVQVVDAINTSPGCELAAWWRLECDSIVLGLGSNGVLQ
jgi:hypothetical protein